MKYEEILNVKDVDEYCNKYSDRNPLKVCEGCLIGKRKKKNREAACWEIFDILVRKAKLEKLLYEQ